MNPINHNDDPRLTAYALGELSSQSEHEQIEALLRPRPRNGLSKKFERRRRLSRASWRVSRLTPP